MGHPGRMSKSAAGQEHQTGASSNEFVVASRNSLVQEQI